MYFNYLHVFYNILVQHFLLLLVCKLDTWDYLIGPLLRVCCLYYSLYLCVCVCMYIYIYIYIYMNINPLHTKRRPLHLKTQSVPRSKHFYPGYKNQSIYAVSGTSCCLFSGKYKTHKYSVGRM